MRLAILSGPDAGRAFPAAALALRLAAAGDDVLVLTGARWVDRLREQGVSAHPLPGSDGDDELAYRRPAAAAAAAGETADLLREWGPDLVVSDVKTLVGPLAAELADLPWVQLHPHPITFSASALGMSGPRGRSGSRSAAPRSRADGARPGRGGQGALAEARAGLGLPTVGASPELNLVATLPVLEPVGRSWPRGASVVGPLVYEPADTDLPLPPGDGPLVMVSPSTSVRGEDLLGVSFAALPGLRMAGATLSPYDGQVPPWATVGVGRQEALLAAASVAVCGGGHGAITRAMLAGVPLVLVPVNDEQRQLARRVADLGVAIVVRRANRRTLRRAVDRVLSDSEMTMRARSVARSVAASDPVALCHQALAVRTST